MYYVNGTGETSELYVVPHFRVPFKPVKICDVHHCRDLVVAGKLLFLVSQSGVQCLETEPGVMRPSPHSQKEPAISMLMAELEVVCPADTNVTGKRFLCWHKLTHPTKRLPRLQPRHLLLAGVEKLMQKHQLSTTSRTVKSMRNELEMIMKISPEEVELAKAATKAISGSGALHVVTGIDWVKKHWEPVAVTARKRNSAEWDVFCIVDNEGSWFVTHLSVSVRTGNAVAQLICSAGLPHTEMAWSSISVGQSPSAVPVLCCCEKGLFTFQNGKVSKLKYQDPPMTFRPHGVTVSAELDGTEIIFATSQPMTTDRAGCFIGVVKIVDGKVSEFAGSAHPRGQNGTMYTLVGDGAAKNCRFLSPFGLSAVHNNVLVVDKDRIRLITPTQQLRSYLKALLEVADAYGLKVRDGEPRRPTLPIAQCLTPLKTLAARLDNIQSEATKRTGRKQTDGTHASISEDTSNTVHRIISGLKSLQHNVHGLIKEDDVLVRSTVTDVNEHFHAEMRKSFESGMMTPLQFHKKLFPVIDASVRRQYYPGFHIPHKRHSMYQTPTSSNEPNCPVRISVPKQEKKMPKLTPDDWAQVAGVVGTKEVMRSVAPRKLTCVQRATYESQYWVSCTERIASQTVVKRDQENSEQKEEVYEFNYGDIVAVAVEALPVSVRQIATTAVFCVVRESVVKSTCFELYIPTHT